MDAALPHLPKLSKLPTTLPRDGSINLVLEGSVPTFRAAPAVVGRVTQLLERDRGGELSQAETEELERYEELDDYLSHLNRVVRNLQSTSSYTAQERGGAGSAAC